MALGGIPYYWSFMKKGLSVAQNFDHIFFDEDGELANEYDALYASLFKNPTIHISGHPCIILHYITLGPA